MNGGLKSSDWGHYFCLTWILTFHLVLLNRLNLEDVFWCCYILAYLLLGVVRVYSKKAEYLFDDCNKVLLNVKDFVLCNKDGILVETLQAPYFSITLPERFELDAFDLKIIEDTSE